MPETQDWAAAQQSPVTILGNQYVVATEIGLGLGIPIGVASRRVVLVFFSMSAPVDGTASDALRDWVVATVTGQTSGVYLARCAVSPATPSALVQIPYGQAIAATGENLLVTCYSRAGAGSQQVGFDLGYYLQ